MAKAKLSLEVKAYIVQGHRKIYRAIGVSQADRSGFHATVTCASLRQFADPSGLGGIRPAFAQDKCVKKLIFLRKLFIRNKI